MLQGQHPLFHRFWDNVLIGDDCWEWQAGTFGGRYGQFRVGKKKRKAHIVSREMLGKEIAVPPMEHDHLCRNKLCVRPSHHEIVTRAVNQARYQETREKLLVCKRGHPVSERDGYGKCKPCRRMRDNAKNRETDEHKVTPTKER